VSVLAAGLLRITKVRLEDMGKYLCWVNNSAGEETVQVTLTVTGKLIHLFAWYSTVLSFHGTEQ
jgi:hypothetical protein